MTAITRELIAERMAEMKKSAEQLQANLNATYGAIQDLEYWLSVIDQENETGEAAAVASPERTEQ